MSGIQICSSTPGGGTTQQKHRYEKRPAETSDTEMIKSCDRTTMLIYLEIIGKPE